MATTLRVRALVKDVRKSPYDDIEYDSTQCSSCQICNFKWIQSFKQFRDEIYSVMGYGSAGFRIGICVAQETRYFWLLKLWFWRWCVQRIGFTLGGGTMWIIHKRIWIA